MRRGNPGKNLTMYDLKPNPIHLVTSPAHFTWESNNDGVGCGSEARIGRRGWHENGFGGGDHKDGDDDDDEDDGGDNRCCSFCSEMGRFSWLIWWEDGAIIVGGRVSDHHHGPFFQLDFFQGLDSFTFFWIFTNQNQIIIHHFSRIALCCAVLSWPRSAVVLCCCGLDRWWFFVVAKPRSVVLAPLSTSPSLLPSL